MLALMHSRMEHQDATPAALAMDDGDGADETLSQEREHPLVVVLRRRGLSENEAARRLNTSQSILKRIMAGGRTTLSTAAKIVYGTGFAVTFEDLLEPDQRRRLQRSYGGVLLEARERARVRAPEIAKRRKAARSRGQRALAAASGAKVPRPRAKATAARKRTRKGARRSRSR